MFNMYNQHKGCNIVIRMDSIASIRDFAEIYAKKRYDGFFRAFEVSEDGSERFVTAFSVLNGKVSEHRDVAIPVEHW